MVSSQTISYAIIMGLRLETTRFGGGAFVPLEGGMKEISGDFLLMLTMCWEMAQPLTFGNINGLGDNLFVLSFLFFSAENITKRLRSLIEVVGREEIGLDIGIGETLHLTQKQQNY
ncbi:hypothetical protein L195_g016134 [Trifolium pratense]|uniref:Uncharacterized protein n=1 Tax=Trifolium pratense TaxID=57577 RepID=A0A2K3MQE7_TRIPR|nr:hypothetical protein L195_g016134 [Trifolium pratense]